METIAKITPADYPDLLAAVDAGMTQRELADRYGCAPSLIARHGAGRRCETWLCMEPRARRRTETCILGVAM